MIKRKVEKYIVSSDPFSKQSLGKDENSSWSIFLFQVFGCEEAQVSPCLMIYTIQYCIEPLFKVTYLGECVPLKCPHAS